MKEIPFTYDTVSLINYSGALENHRGALENHSEALKNRSGAIINHSGAPENRTAASKNNSVAVIYDFVKHRCDFDMILYHFLVNSKCLFN